MNRIFVDAENNNLYIYDSNNIIKCTKRKNIFIFKSKYFKFVTKNISHIKLIFNKNIIAFTFYIIFNFLKKINSILKKINSIIGFINFFG